MNEQEDIDAVRRAIEAFAVEHAQRPFGVLREVGVQAALKRLIDKELTGSHSVTAEIVDRNGCTLDVLSVETDRVRLESKIDRPADEDRPNSPDERTDLLLHRKSNVRLVRYPHGSGDIVYRSFHDSVLAAVEIKASPSHALGQKEGYARDIERLLQLKVHRIAGFFVVLDKSSDFYGPFPGRVRPFNCIRWSLEGRAQMSLSAIVYQADFHAGLMRHWDNILVSSQAPENCPFIEIWNISTEQSEGRRFYAWKLPVA